MSVRIRGLWWRAVCQWTHRCLEPRLIRCCSGVTLFHHGHTCTWGQCSCSLFWTHAQFLSPYYQATSPIGVNVTMPLSLCLSCSCTVLREDIRTQFFVCDSPMSLPDCIEIRLTVVNSSCPKFCPKVIHPCWFERRRHSIANCSGMVTDSAVCSSHNGEPTGNYHRSFECYHHSPLWPPLPPNGGPKYIRGPTLRCVLPPGE